MRYSNDKGIFELFPPRSDLVKATLPYFCRSYAHKLTSDKYINFPTFSDACIKGNTKMVKLLLPYFDPSLFGTEITSIMATAIESNNIDMVKVILADGRISVLDGNGIAFATAIDTSNNAMLNLLLLGLSNDFKINVYLRHDIKILINYQLQTTISRNKNDLTTMLLTFARKHDINIWYPYIQFTKENTGILAEFFLTQELYKYKTIDLIIEVVIRLDLSSILKQILLDDNLIGHINFIGSLEYATAQYSYKTIELLLSLIDDRVKVGGAFYYTRLSFKDGYGPFPCEKFYNAIDVYVESGKVDQSIIVTVIRYALITVTRPYKIERLIKYYNFSDNNFGIVDDYFNSHKLDKDYAERFILALYDNPTINLTKLIAHFKASQYTKNLKFPMSILNIKLLT